MTICDFCYRVAAGKVWQRRRSVWQVIRRRELRQAEVCGTPRCTEVARGYVSGRVGAL